MSETLLNLRKNLQAVVKTSMYMYVELSGGYAQIFLSDLATFISTCHFC